MKQQPLGTNLGRRKEDLVIAPGVKWEPFFKTEAEKRAYEQWRSEEAQRSLLAKSAPIKAPRIEDVWELPVYK